MADEQIDSTPAVEPADEPKGLDAVIEASLGDYQDTAEGSPTVAARDERGRFTSTQQTDSTGEKPASAEAETEQAEAEGGKDADTPEAEPVLSAPDHWPSEDKERFANAPKDIQQWMIDRDKAVARTITEKTQALADERKTLAPVQQVLGQWRGYFNQLGKQPLQAVNELVNADYVLRAGTPAQKQQALEAIIREYGLGDPGYTEPTDPNVAALNHEISQLKAQLGQFQQSQQQAETLRTKETIDGFASAKDGQGNPLHPHFDAVRETMGRLISAGQASTLDDAYKMAVRLDNSIYEQTLEAERKRVAEEEARKLKEAAEKARRVGRTAGGGAPGGQQAVSGLDNILVGALQQAGY